MTQDELLEEVANSNWQPKFEYSHNLDAVVRAINEPHEDYFLGLDSKVKEIIEREIEYAQIIDNYQITFADVCNWQKELFEHKKSIINFHYSKSNYATICPEDLTDEEEDLWYAEQEKHTDIYVKSKGLPNNFIKLGLRQNNVTIGKDQWKFFTVDGFEKFFTDFNEMKTFSTKHTPIPTPVDWWSDYQKYPAFVPPHPMFLEDLKKLCFPLKLEMLKNIVPSSEESYLDTLTEWYKIFETAHFLQDLNGRLGNIVINILSYILTNKYLIK